MEAAVALIDGRDAGMSQKEKKSAHDDLPLATVGSAAPPAELPGDDVQAVAEMLPYVYEELRHLAAGYLRHERPEHTLQRTALVHEAYLRLSAQRDVTWENPDHFLAIFARLMRQTLINHAVARARIKRGGQDPAALICEYYERSKIDVAAIDAALQELEQLDSRQARIVELRFFAGLTIEEIARLLEVSPRTVKREWAMAKFCLRKILSNND